MPVSNTVQVLQEATDYAAQFNAKQKKVHKELHDKVTVDASSVTAQLEQILEAAAVAHKLQIQSLRDLVQQYKADTIALLNDINANRKRVEGDSLPPPAKKDDEST